MNKTLLALIVICTFLFSCSPRVIIEYQGSSPIPKASSGLKPKTEAVSNKKSSQHQTVIVFSIPNLEGGDRALKKKIEYPEEAIQNGVEGIVSILFYINEDGSTSDFEVIKEIGHGCEEAVIKAIQQSTFQVGQVNQHKNGRYIWLVSTKFIL